MWLYEQRLISVTEKNWIQKVTCKQTFEVHSQQTKVEAKAKIVFDVCRLFFDIFRFRFHFRLAWMNPNCLSNHRNSNGFKLSSH